jgi:hypothetical protein
MEFPIIGPSMPSNKLVYSTHRTVNYLPEADQRYKSPYVLDAFPGYELWSAINNGPVRGGIEFKNDLIVVSSSEVIKISSGGFLTKIGTLDTLIGRVGIATDGFSVMIVDGEDGYIWDGVWGKIIDSTFVATKATQVVFHDARYWVNRPGTASFYGSASYDGTTWDATRTATAEFRPDEAVTIFSDRELFVGGLDTVQPYINTGASPMPLEPSRQGRMVYGVAAANSWALVNNTSHWLARDRNGGIFVARANGYSVEKISNRAWERVWSSYDRIDDAFALGIHYKGHELYVLTFPSADEKGRTFFYDSTVNDWFELGIFNPACNDFFKWPITFHSYFADKHVVGDETGNLHIMKDGIYQYDSDTIISLRRAPIIHKERERLFFDTMQIDMEVGKGLTTGQGSDPKIMLDISDDGGMTWKGRRYKSIGLTGESDKRVKFEKLGSSYDRVFQLLISDPIPRRIVGGYVQ